MTFIFLNHNLFNSLFLNVLLNPLQKEDVVKLTEKCGLNSAGGSPVVTPLRTPEDLKSNILKAQAEAAGFKVKNKLHTTGEKGKEDRNDK